jgi:hypothetical protein
VDASDRRVIVAAPKHRYPTLTINFPTWLRGEIEAIAESGRNTLGSLVRRAVLAESLGSTGLDAAEIAMWRDGDGH